MKAHGSYRIIKTNPGFAIGFNKTNIHQYVVWKIDSHDVIDAVFFETYQEAWQDFLDRSERWKELWLHLKAN